MRQKGCFISIWGAVAAFTGFALGIGLGTPGPAYLLAFMFYGGALAAIVGFVMWAVGS